MTDTRLVQTAVLGTPDSHIPVILPTGHTDLDEFRVHQVGQKFWCGMLLNGCGRELVTKRYDDRDCHFAHRADAEAGPSACSRGAHSADHLYIGQAGKRWLRSLGFEVEPQFFGPQHDEAVGFARPGGSTLRFQVSPLTGEQWTDADRQAHEHGEDIAWFLMHPDSEAEAASYDADDPALLMRVQPDGSAALPGRRVEIGTRTSSGEVKWDPLEECQLNEGGQVETPTLRVRGLRRPIRNTPIPDEGEPPAAPWQPSVHPSRDAREVRQRIGLTNEAAKRESLLAQAADIASRLRLESRTEPPNLPYIRILRNEAQTLMSQVEAAEPQHQLLYDAISRATALLEQPNPQPAKEDAHEKSSGSESQAPSDSQHRPPAQTFGPREVDLGNMARQVLIEAARAQERLPWKKLCARMNRPDQANADGERIYQILGVADTDPYSRDHPLFSALVMESDPPRQADAFIRIAYDRGRTVPKQAAQRAKMLKDEVAAVFAYWKTPPSH